MPYAQDCAVRLRPPDPQKVPVMHGVVSPDGKTVTMAIADVPPDGIMQRDTEFCESAAWDAQDGATKGLRRREADARCRSDPSSHSKRGRVQTGKPAAPAVASAG